MRNEDNACIRYLMKEMDPSEEVLMERAMMEDDDLLIEVESLRQTLKRLDKLPKVHPPSQLSESIIQQAAAHAREQKKSSPRIFSTLNMRYAAAATVLIGAVAGSIWIITNNQDPKAGSGQSERPAPPVAEQLKVIPGGRQASSMASDRAESGSGVEPWVDHNDIIRFQDLYNNSNNDSGSIEAILKSSEKKLTPLNDQFDYNSGIRSLELTSSPVPNNQ